MKIENHLEENMNFFFELENDVFFKNLKWN